MCGIAGIARRRPSGVATGTLGRMAAAIRHRGPDGYGFFSGSRVGLAHVRLSIVDLAGGAQPMATDDQRIIVVYNGEIYNHIELRRELTSRGHEFRTRSDTEVLLHGYEEWGTHLLSRLNGQFAFALYDRRTETIFLARDRFGVRPLFYAQQDGAIYFGSEVKALLASGELEAALDPLGLDEIATFWAAVPPRTAFRGVSSLEPGTFGLWRDGVLALHRYYELDFPDASVEPADAVERLDEIMVSGVGMRLRADVPVGAYLSGGLDSTITTVLAAAASPHQLRSFSIGFDDERFDETPFQRTVAEVIGTLHSSTRVGGDSIANSLHDVIWHTETPILRTAPVPMYHLAKLTKDSGIKVVLTGEGADELFLGYDIFKEVSVRRFCLRRPDSAWRQRLFDRLYPYLFEKARSGEFWRRFFLSAADATDPVFSHLPRWLLTSRMKAFFSADMKAELAQADAVGDLRASLPTRFFGWSPLNQAAYLEMTTLLSPYLLSSQGDRMAMAHGVEGRYPFLDHRLFEFTAALPTGSRLRGLHEKELLRRWARRVLPASLGERGKQPYRAPDAASFFGADSPDWIGDCLQEDALRRIGVFDPAAVAGLIRRCRAGLVTGFRENQALLAVLTTQLWHHHFIERPTTAMSLPVKGADVVLQDSVAAHS